MNGFISRVFSVILFAFFSSIVLWHFSTDSDTPALVSVPPDAKQNPVNSDLTARNPKNDVKQNPAKTKENAVIDKLLANYTYKWKKQEKNFKAFRSSLSTSGCDAISSGLVTQDNSPIGTNITYDGEQTRIVVVTQVMFSLFPKDNPFKKAPWDSCAVVGNGGILANSSYGKQIDSATFVIRCNLPPVNNGYEKDTGSKTSLVTANPTIFIQTYNWLHARRRPFVNDMQVYGETLVLLPAFSFGMNTDVSMRVFYTLEDFSSNGQRVVFFNPKYMKSLAEFWRGHGLKVSRLSTGIMITSLAVQLCNNVHLYGFWPFGMHPYTRQDIPHHYYDNKGPTGFHSMSAEFEALLNLHNKGVIHLHL